MPTPVAHTNGTPIRVTIAYTPIRSSQFLSVSAEELQETDFEEVSPDVPRKLWQSVDVAQMIIQVL